MKLKTIAICVFYTKDKRILLQKRHSISKWGEEWGFWGGTLEKGETKEEALIREIEEELDYHLEKFYYLGNMNKTIKHVKGDYWNLTCEIFVSEFNGDLTPFAVSEGDGLGLFTLADARKLKMNPLDPEIISLVEDYLTKKL